MGWNATRKDMNRRTLLKLVGIVTPAALMGKFPSLAIPEAVISPPVKQPAEEPIPFNPRDYAGTWKFTRNDLGKKV